MSVNATRMLQFYQHFGKFYAQQFAPLSSLDNCTVTYDQSEYYLVTIITYQDVHKAANIREMTDLGIIDKDYTTGQYATSVSLNKTKADLLANGAIQR